MLIFVFSNLALAKHMLNVVHNFFNFRSALLGQFIKNLTFVLLGMNFFNLVLLNESFASESKVGFFYANFAYEKTWGTYSILINNEHNFLVDFNVFSVPAIANTIRQNANFKQSPCKILSFFHAFSISLTNFFGKQIFNNLMAQRFFLPNFGVWSIFMT